MRIARTPGRGARAPWVVAVAVAGVVLTGCGGTSATDGPRTDPTRSAAPAPSAASPSPARSSDAPASPVETASQGVELTAPWATAPMTDVRTGETFTLADFVRDGKVVFVEPMAIWCSSCRAQQERAMQAFERLDPERVVWVGLDVETAESADQLAAYADDRGFAFRYVIADRDLALALVEAFGEVILSPPATNLIRIDVQGGVSHTVGGHSADDLVTLAEAASA